MNKKMITVFVILLVILIVIVTIILLSNKTKKRIKIVKIEKFNCLSGFFFEYPVFKDWEVKIVEKRGENECVIQLNHPDNIEFEYPPEIRIIKMPELGLNSTKEKTVTAVNKKLNLVPIKVSDSENNYEEKNKNGVSYAYVCDPSLYTEDSACQKGTVDYLQFYGPDFGVRIWCRAGWEEFGFSKNKLFKTIIETFKFSSPVLK